MCPNLYFVRKIGKLVEISLFDPPPSPPPVFFLNEPLTE